MRVLVVHNYYRSDVPSGENRVVDDEVAALRAAGVDVATMTRTSDEIASMSARSKMAVALSPVHSVQAVRDLRRRITESRPDVLHLHNPYPFFSLSIVNVAAELGVPVVQTVHNHRHTCMKGTYQRDGRDCRDCLSPRVPWPGVVHGCYRDSRAQSIVMATALTVHSPVSAPIRRFLALTPEIAQSLRDAGVAEDRIALKPNAVPDPGTPVPVGSSVLFIGRLSAEKGADVLAESWLSHADGAAGMLEIVGDGDAAPRLATALGHRSDVVLRGSLDRSDVAEAMSRAGVVIVPSIWPEAMPLVTLEAMAAGRGLLVSDVGGLPGLLPAGAGEVVAPTVDAWAAALASPRSATTLQAWGDAARSAYVAGHAPPASVAALLAIYAEVVAEATR